MAAEPKALSAADLRNFVKKYGSYKVSAQALGVSEAFIRQNAQEKKYQNKRRKNESQ
jgi:hypothetical protein